MRRDACLRRLGLASEGRLHIYGGPFGIVDVMARWNAGRSAMPPGTGARPSVDDALIEKQNAF